jgi:CBS domain containing-hemolysin-like protein
MQVDEFGITLSNCASTADGPVDDGIVLGGVVPVVVEFCGAVVVVTTAAFVNGAKWPAAAAIRYTTTTAATAAATILLRLPAGG